MRYGQLAAMGQILPKPGWRRWGFSEPGLGRAVVELEIETRSLYICVWSLIVIEK
jgi:hypothetical protein